MYHSHEHKLSSGKATRLLPWDSLPERKKRASISLYTGPLGEARISKVDIFHSGSRSAHRTCVMVHSFMVYSFNESGESRGSSRSERERESEKMRERDISIAAQSPSQVGQLVGKAARVKWGDSPAPRVPSTQFTSQPHYSSFLGLCRLPTAWEAGFRLAPVRGVI
jgi:hypothetical protein